jgi:predicted DNA-binding transcriptional regulator AlpA
MTFDTSGALTAPAPAHRLIDVRELSRLLGLSTRTALRHADAGLIPKGHKLGALRRWDAAEVDRFIAGGCKPKGAHRAR